MREIPDFIWQLVEEGIPVELTKAGFKLPGFYKSGEITIVPCEPCWGKTWKALQRYNEEDHVESVEDVVSINNSWRLRQNNGEESKPPDCHWAALLEKHGYLKKKIIPAQTIYT